MPDVPLMHAISAESISRITDLAWLRTAGRDALQGFVQFILAVAWSLSFLQLISNDAFRLFDKATRLLGAEADARAAAGQLPDRSVRSEGDVAWILTRSGIPPSLLIDLPGMVTIYKPTDWEVDGLDVEEGEHPPLSAYMQSIFPKAHFPLVWDAEHSYGFLHRLDIPSSGLVLGGTTYEGYYCLRLQLDTQRLRREYVVLCHGSAPATMREVVARVDVAPDPSQRRSVSDSGKPSQTLVCVAGHVRGATEAEEGRMCVTAIRIFTGRRHQIRVHVRHSGHPSVADARYTCREAFIAGPGPGSRSRRNLEAAGRRWTYNATSAGEA